MKLAIIDKRIPNQAKIKLAEYYKIIEFESTNITNDYLSGHPDIFFSYIDNKVIYAPNTHSKYIDILYENNISLIKGKKEISFDYPFCSHYNCVAINDLIIHNLQYSDTTILNLANKSRINVKQGLTRCSLLALSDKDFITSDQGIYKILSNIGMNILLINPENILLPGMKYGFIGGCCGIDLESKSIFIIGNLKYIKDGNIFYKFCNYLGYKIIELYDGQLFDGGSILIV